MSSESNWTVLTESQFAWEREALDFVRERFPEHEPYRAWSNFEFIADDGSINEVDLLVFSPQGFFLIEIKSRPGRVHGDAGTWTWETEGSRLTVDNPLLATNRKAKKLVSLLKKQRVFRKKAPPPFLEALVFLSAEDQRCDLKGTGRSRVCLRDREADDGRSGTSGIMAALTNRKCPGLEGNPKGKHDRPAARHIEQALDQAGIRPSQRQRRVGDYILEQQLDEAPGYQDWAAKHTQLDDDRVRIRIYHVRATAAEEERATIERAAQREYQLLRSLKHPGVPEAYGFTQHELGPALILEFFPKAIRLDHFLQQNSDELAIGARLELMREIANVIRFAHEKKVVHRGLSPRSILIVNPGSERPQVKIFNWHSGYRTGTASTVISREVAATDHLGQLMEDSATAYLAPEAISNQPSVGEHLDVFSLGAIAYHLFSGQPPAENGLELADKIRQTKGLQISSVLNGATESLEDLIFWSTRGDVPSRFDRVHDFLAFLDIVEEELTEPDQDLVEDPSLAQKGDLLPGGFIVKSRLGQGACSVALLVGHGEEEFVLKVANSDDQNERLADEAEVLQSLQHQHIVNFERQIEIGGRTCLLMQQAGTKLLRNRLSADGALQLELLQRFGEDLIEVVRYLEEQGIPHRDIKPDNIGVGPVGRGDQLHLVLFDFSLSRSSTENINAGTVGYLDPMLPLRATKRWDLDAERYAAAATLYEMATGGLPVWGDGDSDPSQLDCEITLEPERLDAVLRDNLTVFFSRAFRRDPAERFDNAEEMLKEWRHCFEEIEAADDQDEELDAEEFAERVQQVRWDSQIPELQLSTRAHTALDRANILTVRDLLTFQLGNLLHMRGVGRKTRNELALVVRLLRDSLGEPVFDEESSDTDQPQTTTDGQDDLGLPSVDRVLARIRPPDKGNEQSTTPVANSLLGLGESSASIWPSQSDVATQLELSRQRVNQIVGKLRDRWGRLPDITQLRIDLKDILEQFGNVMSIEELATAILKMRGSVLVGEARTSAALAIIRAVVEVEQTQQTPRYVVGRDADRVVIGISDSAVQYGLQLGEQADELAEQESLIQPDRALDTLRSVGRPKPLDELSDDRIIHLAQSASRNAALSSRREFYPRGMDAGRAILLSRGALSGVPKLTAEQIQQRVTSRYHEAQPIPGHPRLEDLLQEAGLSFRWDSNETAYVSTFRPALVSSGSDTLQRQATFDGGGGFTEVTADIADAREFEERLQHADRDGAFLALVVPSKHYERAIEELDTRFAVEVIDIEERILETLQVLAKELNVDWQQVLNTDRDPDDDNWNLLLQLVNRTVERLEPEWTSNQKTLLFVYAGLLARYDQMPLLERLRDRLTRADGLHGLWLLVPGSQTATLEGQLVPVHTPAQIAQIPESWLQNAHRSSRPEASSR